MFFLIISLPKEYNLCLTFLFSEKLIFLRIRLLKLFKELILIAIFKLCNI